MKSSSSWKRGKEKLADEQERQEEDQYMLAEMQVRLKEDQEHGNKRAGEAGR